jgi:hypothetical protein
MSHTDFQLAGGTVIGRDHRLKAWNNQDGYHILRDAYTVAVVTDGCGSGAHSEVGAQLGARLVAQAVLREAVVHGEHNLHWSKIRMDLMAALHVLASQMGGNFRETVSDYFLFTVVGVLLAAETATFFAIGDGVIIVNGEVTQLGPFAGNMPPYVGYGLLAGWEIDVVPEEVQFKVLQQVSLRNLDHFMVGSDGLARAEAGPPGLLDLADAGAKLPGLATTVDPIDRFWQDDAVFKNPAIVCRRLKLIGRDWPVREPEHGLLADDTTLVVGRRIPIPTNP